MSRRSLIPEEERLLRSQRRGVPNVSMWSEAPTPPVVDWQGYEAEYDYSWPSDMRLTATNVWFGPTNLPWNPQSFDAGTEYDDVPLRAYPGIIIQEPDFDIDYWRGTASGTRMIASMHPPGLRLWENYTVAGYEISPNGTRRSNLALVSLPFGGASAWGDMHSEVYVSADPPYTLDEWGGMYRVHVDLTNKHTGQVGTAYLEFFRVFTPAIKTGRGTSGMSVNTELMTYTSIINDDTSVYFPMPPYPEYVEWGTYWVNDVSTEVTVNVMRHSQFNMIPTAGYNTARARVGMFWRWTTRYGAKHLLVGDPSGTSWRWGGGLLPSSPPDALTDREVVEQVRAAAGPGYTWGYENAQNQYYYRLLSDPIPPTP